MMVSEYGEGGFVMKIILEDKLKDYMNTKELKDIVLYSDMCNT